MALPPDLMDEDPAPTMRWFWFGLSGRIGRLPYVLGVLFMIAVTGFFVSRLSQVPEDSAAFTILFLGMFVYSLASVWMVVATSIKRLHDINIPGAVVLTLFVPAVSIVALLVLCVWPGTNGPNNYGDDYNRPKS